MALYLGDRLVFTYFDDQNAPIPIFQSSPEIEYLVVAGGGHGSEATSDNNGGGGGGGGGVLTGSLSEIQVNTNYTITVGGGGEISGSTAVSVRGGSGEDSVFYNLTAIGGGGGGSQQTTAQAKDGGSGGGGGAGPLATSGSGTPGQGNDGGISLGIWNLARGCGVGADGISRAAGGGGGGASITGSNSVQWDGGNGGAGIVSYLTGVVKGYGGGGGGGAAGPSSGLVCTGGVPGVGTGTGGLATDGGGRGGTRFGQTYPKEETNGQPNSGGGGGGITDNAADRTIYSKGGSGVVILKYSDAYTITSGSNLISNQYNSDGYKITEFISGSGDIQFVGSFIF